MSPEETFDKLSGLFRPAYEQARMDGHSIQSISRFMISVGSTALASSAGKSCAVEALDRMVDVVMAMPKEWDGDMINWQGKNK